jgi:hypothetical protein
MKKVLSFIEEKKYDFSQLPLCHYMRDNSIDPRQRLSWAPWLAPYAMNFGDLNKYVLRKEPTTDKIQKMINVHTFEDDHHWRWFLEDLETLGFNPRLKYSDALRLVWSKQAEKSRLICSKLALMFESQSDSLLRLAITEAIEATGHVILFLTSQVTKQLQPITQENYRYFGPSHFDVETGHPTGTENVEDFIKSLELTEQTRQQAYELVEQVFELFTELIQELMAKVKTSTSYLPSLDSFVKQSQSKPIGAYLAEAGLITLEQLDMALQQQQYSQRRLGEVLSSNGFVNQQTIEYMMEHVIHPDRELAVSR